MPAKDYTKWHLPKGAKLRLGKGYINEIAYSPDSSRLAIASSIGIWIYDAETGEELDLFTGHTGSVGRLLYSPDGHFIASSSADKTVRLWDAVTGEQKAILNHDNNVSGFVYSPDGNTITTESQGKVYLWNAITGEQKAILTERLYDNLFFSFAYSPDGSTIAIKPDHEICLWNAITGEQKATITGESFVLFVYSPDGSTIATASSKEMCLWDTVTGERKVTLTNVGNSESFVVGDFESFAYSPDGKTITTINYSRSYQREVKLWDAVTGEHKFTFTGDSFAYSPDGHTIVTWKDKEIYLWDAITREHKITLAIDANFNDNLYPQWIQDGSLEYSPDGSTIAALIPIDSMLGGGVAVCLWDTSTGELKASRLDGTWGLEYSPDGKTIALKGTNTNFMTLLDAVTGEHKATLEYTATLTDDFTQPRFQYSPDGKTIVSKSSKEVYLWDVITGERKVTITGHTHNVFSFTYSPDGKTISTGGDDGTVLLWDRASYIYMGMNINPQEIHGNWRAGWALDVHTLSSRPLPGGGYDTERTEFGEWVYQLKYRHDRTKIQPIAEVAAEFVKEQFAVDGHPILPYLKAVLPIPPSDQNRDFQPVTEVTQEIGKLLSVPVRTDYLTKVKQTTPLKNLPDVASKQEQLSGAFVVRSQDLKNQCILLVDDLYDSGTTLTEVSKVLYEQGSVQHVLVLTLTRTRTGGN